MKVIIIDDEPDCIAVLEKLLIRYCPQVEILGSTTYPLEGVEMVRLYKPSLLFLDIEMPMMNGFQLLDATGTAGMHVVFTTAYDQYAPRAFKYSALDYLLKPIEGIELKLAVEKAQSREEIHPGQLELARKHLRAVKGTAERIALPQPHGFTFIEIAHILYCEADDYYTKIFLLNGEIHLVGKTLSEIEALLEEHPFYRVHRQYLISTKHVKRYIKGDGNFAIMDNDRQIPIAKGRRDEFEHLFLKL